MSQVDGHQMKPDKIPAELIDKQLPEIFLYMRRRGFSIDFHKSRTIALEAADAAAIWNLSDSAVA